MEFVGAPESILFDVGLGSSSLSIRYATNFVLFLASGHFPLPGHVVKSQHVFATMTTGLYGNVDYGAAPGMAMAGMTMGVSPTTPQMPVTPAAPSTIARQTRRLYVGSIPFGISEVYTLAVQRTLLDG
jgi:hypothetical protein